MSEGDIEPAELHSLPTEGCNAWLWGELTLQVRDGEKEGEGYEGEGYGCEVKWEDSNAKECRGDKRRGRSWDKERRRRWHRYTTLHYTTQHCTALYQATRHDTVLDTMHHILLHLLHCMTHNFTYDNSLTAHNTLHYITSHCPLAHLLMEEEVVHGPTSAHGL